MLCVKSTCIYCIMKYSQVKQHNYECIYIAIYMYTPKLSQFGWEEKHGLGLGGNKARHICTVRMYIGL